MSQIFKVVITLLLLIQQNSSISNSTPSPDNSDDGSETDTDIVNDWIKSKNTSLATKSNVTPQNSAGDKCNCVKYYQCKTVANSSTASDKDPQEILGVVDIRSPNSTNGTALKVNNGCQHYFEVCCKTVKPESETTEKPLSSEEPKPDAIVKKDFRHTSCGHRNENGLGFKITGGTGGESEFGEFPWMTAVTEAIPVEVDSPQGKVNVTKSALLCGGSLIHPQVVLTTAHCVFEIANSPRYNALKVRVGEWDTQTTDEPYPHQDRGVKEVIIHHQLLRKTLYNDIALLILENEVKLAPNVDTICLPPLSMKAKDFDGESCFSSGWGKDNFGTEGRYQDIMKKIQVPIVPKTTCETALRKTRLGDRFILHESFICAGGQPGGQDTCVGDGGSPLVCKAINSPNYVQAGIVAWGIGCRSDTPAVYVNVPMFVPWILEKLKKRNLDAKFCTLE